MRYGGGSRLKLLNALAMGCAVVATTAGAEGVDVRPGEHLLIADTPEEFAAAVGTLLADPELRTRLGTAGRAFMRDHYDWAGIAARIVAGYDAAFAIRETASARATAAQTPTDAPATAESSPQ